MPPFRPDAFFAIASALQERRLAPTGEGRDRTITGRAYYAAFLATCDALCAQHGFPPDAYFGHERVSDTLAGYDNDVDVKKLGTSLNSLRLLRVAADYSRRKTHEEGESDDAYAYAQDILAGLPGLTGRLPRIEPMPKRK